MQLLDNHNISWIRKAATHRLYITDNRLIHVKNQYRKMEHNKILRLTIIAIGSPDMEIINRMHHINIGDNLRKLRNLPVFYTGENTEIAVKEKRIHKVWHLIANKKPIAICVSEQKPKYRTTNGRTNT